MDFSGQSADLISSFHLRATSKTCEVSVLWWKPVSYQIRQLVIQLCEGSYHVHCRAAWCASEVETLPAGVCTPAASENALVSGAGMFSSQPIGFPDTGSPRSVFTLCYLYITGINNTQDRLVCSARPWETVSQVFDRIRSLDNTYGEDWNII